MTEHNSPYLRQRRSSPVYDRPAPFLIGPEGEIVTAAPAQDDPRVTGLLPEDLPNDNDSGASQTVKEEGPSAVSGGSLMQTTTLPSSIDSSVSLHATVTSTMAASSSVASVLAMSVSSSQISTSFAASFSSTNPIPSGAVPITSSSLLSVVSESTTSPSANIPTSQATSLANATASSPAHSARLRVGIVAGAVVGLVALAILLLWHIRRRNRSRREEVRNNSKWPWDRDDQHLEDGFDHSFARGFAFRSAWVGGLDEKPTKLQSPPNVLVREGVAHSTYHVPPGNSPYPTVEVPNAHGSVPDLAPDLGRLQVTNYAPGDVSSDGGSHSTSRASSISSHHRTSSQRSRRHRTLAWSPPPLEPTNAPLMHEAKEPIFDVTELPELPVPGEPVSTPPEIKVVLAHDGWAASLRTSIVNAFQGVLGGTTNVPDTDLTGAQSSQRNEGISASREDEFNYFYHAQAEKSSTMENHRRNISLGHASADLHGLAEGLALALEESNRLVEPMPVVVKSRDRRQTARGTVSRASSLYSTTSATSTQNTYTLPDIPGISRTGSESSLYQAVQAHRTNTHEAHEYSDSGSPRSAALRRAASRGSTCSAGSSISRACSNASGLLNDGERFAQHVLQERRERLAAAKAGHVKHSLRQPGTSPFEIPEEEPSLL